MFLWLKELLDRRDAEAERERQHELDLRVCNSCATLQDELVRAHSREKDLINLLKAIKEPESSVPFESKVELPNLRKPWAVKRQELEMKSRGDRRKVTADNLDEELELVKENAK